MSKRISGSGWPYIDKVFSGFGYVTVEPSYPRRGEVHVKIMLQPSFDPTEPHDDNAVRLSLYDQAERAVVIAKNQFEVIEVDLWVKTKPGISEHSLRSEGLLGLTITAKKDKPL